MKIVITAALSATLLLSGTGSALAFDDVNQQQKQAITSLQQQGVIAGMSKDSFEPESDLSYAQAITLLMNAYDLNIDNMRFIKMPVATDLYTHVSDKAWYADALVFAYYNDVKLDKSVNVADSISREQFATLLMDTLERKAGLPMINLVPADIKDESDITAGNQGAIQRALHYKIITLHEDGTFQPNEKLTRGEAAQWLYNSLQLLHEKTGTKQAPTEDAGQ
ncbi:S-layer homology domain-containing protein [Paenibacillus sp. WLX2291]|uniref:S-layer homology domain-containing protein n=1 Tax=Paenibacillus sp. WLX2291 TaxID=3296934 RepID=UPI0039843326